MGEVSNEGLLRQLDQFVALIAAPAKLQEDWARRCHFPAEELALQYYDAVPAWFTHLRELSLIDDSDERVLTNLKTHLLASQTKLFEDGPHVTHAPEWHQVRDLASAALESLTRRPRSQKG